MKKYFIIFDPHPHKVDWKKLYHPAQHELILIVIPQDIGLPPSYTSLKKADQLKYFSKVIELPTMDFSTLQSKVQQAISSFNQAGIQNEQLQILSDGELCLLKASRLREVLKLNGPKPANIIHFRNKILAKQKLAENGLEKYLPKYMPFDVEKYQINAESYIDHIISKLGLPIFAKPIDLVSSINTGKIQTRDDLKKWCHNNKNNSFMELEEYIDGQPYHCDSLIKNGKIVRMDVGQKINPSADFLSGKPNGSLTLSTRDPLWEKIYAFNQMILQALEPPDGCTDMDLFITPDNRLIFIECAARTPAEFIPEMYKTSTGIDYYLAHYQLQMRLDANFVTDHYTPTAWIVIPPKKGVLKANYELKNLSSSYIIRWSYKAGDMLEAPKNLVPYICLMIIKNENEAKLREDLEKIKAHQFYSIQDNNEISPPHYGQNHQMELEASRAMQEEQFQGRIRALLDG